MAERVTIRQKSNFETEFWAAAPDGEEGGHLHPVGGLHELTPYGMLLASLGGCTAIVLNTYASNHGLPLEQVELRLSYERRFDDDCENCERIQDYREVISEEIVLHGALDEKQRQKLYQVSKQCPIHKMLVSGAPVESRLLEGAEAA